MKPLRDELEFYGLTGTHTLYTHVGHYSTVQFIYTPQCTWKACTLSIHSGMYGNLGHVIYIVRYRPLLPHQLVRKTISDLKCDP